MPENKDIYEQAFEYAKTLKGDEEHCLNIALYVIENLQHNKQLLDWETVKKGIDERYSEYY